MTRKEKQALASMLICEAGSLIEFYQEKIETDPNSELLKNIPVSEAAQTIANWLKNLPTQDWSMFLPPPK